MKIAVKKRPSKSLTDSANDPIMAHIKYHIIFLQSVQSIVANGTHTHRIKRFGLYNFGSLMQ